MQKLQQILWFTFGLILGFSALSITRASVPSGSGSYSRVTDDTALYQQLSEIHVKKQAKIDFDSDINRLAQLEGSYREVLPSASSASVSHSARLKAPMQRVAQQKYRAVSPSLRK